MTTKLKTPKRGDKVGILALRNRYDIYVDVVLDAYLHPRKRAKGAPRTFSVIRTLPDKEHYLRLRDIYYSQQISHLIATAYATAESLKEEFQEMIDGTPDNLQNSDLTQQRQQAVDDLEQIEQDKFELPSEWDGSVVHLPGLTVKSRNDQCCEAADQLDTAAKALEATWTANQGSHDVTLLRQYIDTIEGSAEAFRAVSCPGMYG